MLYFWLTILTFCNTVWLGLNFLALPGNWLMVITSCLFAWLMGPLRKAESILHELAKKTFLTDWCYPNPLLPDGKELCDLLVVFGDTAIIW